MASRTGTLYIGFTTDLDWRVHEHKNKRYPNSFTAKYNCTKLVYFEEYDNSETARFREFKIKKWNRSKKETLIRSLNPAWIDLSEQRKRQLKKEYNVPF